MDLIDVSIIHDGKPAYTFISNTDQYEYFPPKVNLEVIGAGGGSLVRAHHETHTMTVGPDSAGAFPGPVCYGRGGTVPTVTDAQLVLGYLDPENFAGGSMKLNHEAATRAVGKIGSQLGMSAVECAAGICRIVELQMADVIRRVTVEKGFDPRDFVVFAFGGAGPAHAGIFARELGVRKVIVPLRKAAAHGARSALQRRTCRAYPNTRRSCADAGSRKAYQRNLEALAEKAVQMMKGEGIVPHRQRFEFRSMYATRGRS